MLHLPHLSFCTLYMFFVVFYDGNKLDLDLDLDNSNVLLYAV